MIKHEGIIRLKVAAICTSLDTLIVHSNEDEEEIAPFLATVEKRYYDRWTREEHVTSAPVEPHAFLYMTPSGALAEHVDIVLSALRRSVENGELEASKKGRLG